MLANLKAPSPPAVMAPAPPQIIRMVMPPLNESNSTTVSPPSSIKSMSPTSSSQVVPSTPKKDGQLVPFTIEKSSPDRQSMRPPRSMSPSPSPQSMRPPRSMSPSPQSMSPPPGRILRPDRQSMSPPPGRMLRPESPKRWTSEVSDIRNSRSMSPPRSVPGSKIVRPVRALGGWNKGGNLSSNIENLNNSTSITQRRARSLSPNARNRRAGPEHNSHGIGRHRNWQGKKVYHVHDRRGRIYHLCLHDDGRYYFCGYDDNDWYGNNIYFPQDTPLANIVAAIERAIN